MEPLQRYEPLIPDFDGFLDALHEPLPTTVRVNTIRATPERVVQALQDEGIETTRRAHDETLLEVDTDKPGNTWPYVHGWIHGQEEVSTLPPRILDPQPGETVWAAAAAPGGKATQLAALMNDQGLVIGNDDNLGRLSALRANADRLGVTSMAVTNQDARNYSFNPLGLESVDRALVDAPCTCEGTVRKNPDALDEAGPGASRGLANIQRDILERAVQATRPGGTVVYSTCTFAPEENEAVVDAILDSTDAAAIDFESPLPAEPGVTAWEGAEYDPAVTKTKRYYPHQTDTGGFYVAKLAVKS
ncbi:RsmB/NOP family class I SAM-dependent RNA methyltransferase [Halodesulfurarchaeum formicicum]|uniref:RNA methylase n=1 Tax=Halodesulfurarchaeum formicicum TaxID=1873524 RepID=A0A1J1ACH3_9EURY|nr:RsmB/NOP family class I SAM-dependent RNA methyltransferase [Halodesulfurarchaeum formicicum]APE95456.1 RNA methylase [Halodesulfurarchaeum formicicum]